MTPAIRISPVLAAELDDLNDDQREAVRHTGNIVVRAGPGSGKTRTLVAKVGYLLDAHVSRRQGVAAITYTRHAAREIITRLDQLGIRSGRRLTCGTLHSWCLSAILRPYGPLLGVPVPGHGEVIDDKDDEWINLLQRCFDDVRLTNQAQYETATITKLRRQIAAGRVDDEDNPMVVAARLFDERLLAEGLWDFDAMIAQSLRIVEQHPTVARLIGSRYPWLVIDEYQDLGPVLHALVLALHETVDVGIAAFGDPDQSVMGFTGADPRYLNELAARDNFHDPPLNVNYRCGQAIIAASHAALKEPRTYRADPTRTDHGVIDPIAIPGGLDDHAAVVINRITELTVAGVPAHQIAILYPRKGPLLTELTQALEDSDHHYVHERDERLPDGDLAEFVRDCAARALAGHLPIGLAEDAGDATVRTLGDLTDDYTRLRHDSGLAGLPGRTAGRLLATLLNNTNLTGPYCEDSLSAWITKLSQALDLEAVAAGSPTLRDQQALTRFRQADTRHGLTVNDIAAGALRIGKVTLTTYHSAKGREWDVVILPGLVDGIMPDRRWSKLHRRHLEPTPDKLEQDRRSFYVGLTRAKTAVILMYGTYWETSWGTKNEYEVSRFARDVLDHLNRDVRR